MFVFGTWEISTCYYSHQLPRKIIESNFITLVSQPSLPTNTTVFQGYQKYNLWTVEKGRAGKKTIIEAKKTSQTWNQKLEKRRTLIISWPNTQINKQATREFQNGLGSQQTGSGSQPNWEANEQAGKPLRSQLTDRLGTQEKGSQVRRKLSSDPPCRPFKWTLRP